MSDERPSEQQFPDDCYCSEGPIHYKICDECSDKGVIEP